MGYGIRDLPALLKTPIGRRWVLGALINRLYPPLCAIATVHRCTVARSARWVAVVGSFGKSTTTRAVTIALGGREHPGMGRNNRSYLAFNVLRVGPRVPRAVIEVAINGPGQMARHARMVRPHIVVVTSIGSEHSRHVGTLDAIRNEKAEMVRWLPASGLAVLNADDPNVAWMAGQTRARVVTFGFSESADIRASGYRLDWPNGSRWMLHTDDGLREVGTGLLGRHMVRPILAAIAVARAGGIPLETVLARLETFRPGKRCLEPVRLSNGAILLRDEYKSAAETVDAAFDLAAEIPAKRRILVLGELSDLVWPRKELYERLGERCGGIFSQAILLMGNSFRSFVRGARTTGLSRQALVRVSNVQEILGALPADLGAGDVVLIKGRTNQQLGRVTLGLLGRHIGCSLTICDLQMVRCGNCPMLERGWPEGQTRLIETTLTSES